MFLLVAIGYDLITTTLMYFQVAEPELNYSPEQLRFKVPGMAQSEQIWVGHGPRMESKQL